MADIFYNKTVTVYNRYIDDLTDKEIWYPTVLQNVHLLINKGANVSKSGTDSADAAKLFIKAAFLPPDSKTYCMPKEWQRLSEEEKQKYFTFTSADDFFVEGNTTVEEVLEEDFFSYMKQKYDNCFKITNADKYDLIPHFEVGGA